MRFTILTPTYNRASLLWNLFYSLQRQSFRDFEWVIVDDGSTDNTEDVVAQMQSSDHFFPIVFRKTQNGGKHRAWNHGVDLSSGEMIFGCDSDDYLPPDALGVTDLIEKTIPLEEKAHFAGVCGLKGYPDGNEVGNTFQNQAILDMTYLEREKNGVKGDKAEVFYSSVWKTYRYKEFDNENFLTEATSLMRMAEDGLKIRFFNSIIKTIEYRPDGLSANVNERFVKCPQGWGLYISQRIKHGMLTGKGKWDVVLNYYSLCRDKLSITQMARYLHMPAIELFSKVYETKIKNRIKKWL